MLCLHLLFLHTRTHAGVGVAVEDQFLGTIPNNSVIITSGSQMNILCHSASKTACSSLWLSPSKEIVTDKSECSPLLYSYASLSMPVRQNGIYTCTIADEHNTTKSVYIGIYDSLTELELESEFHNN